MGTGNTQSMIDKASATTVHPRGHGEHEEKQLPIHLASGSSPWARGTLTWFGGGIQTGRFIPVGTGNTFPRHYRQSAGSVHPRGHGEHCCRPALNQSKRGSSPWARGTRLLLPVHSSPGRFIPVGTGNTSRNKLVQVYGPVHPRGHGEHSNYRQLIYKENNPIEKSTRFLKNKLRIISLAQRVKIAPALTLPRL